MAANAQRPSGEIARSWGAFAAGAAVVYYALEKGQRAMKRLRRRYELPSEMPVEVAVQEEPWVWLFAFVGLGGALLCISGLVWLLVAAALRRRR